MPRGRPKTSTAPRAEQLRAAKRAQRERERRQGFRTVQLRLPAALAERLQAAARLPAFEREVADFVAEQLVAVDEHPVLRELMWTGRRREIVGADEAFRIYERHWRFVRSAALDPKERKLIERLAERYGAGLINA